MTDTTTTGCSTTWAPGVPCRMDLGATDRDRAVTFYAGVFEWAASEPAEEVGGYSTFALADDRVGAVTATRSPDQPSGWGVDLMTPDAGATATAIRTHGGQVTDGPDPVGDLGA